MTEQEILEDEYDEFIGTKETDKLYEQATNSICSLMRHSFRDGWKRCRDCEYELSRAPRTPKGTAE